MSDAREDVGEDVGVVECGLYAIVCVGETSDIVGVESAGETSAVRTPAQRRKPNPNKRVEETSNFWNRG